IIPRPMGGVGGGAFVLVLVIISLTRLPHRSTLFPYTTLFRSLLGGEGRRPGSHHQSERERRESHGSLRKSVLRLYGGARAPSTRSEEHTSELQSLRHLVCRLLLEKKKLLHFLSLMLGSVLVLILPLLIWLTPDLRIKKSLLKCNCIITTTLPRFKMKLNKILLPFN